ncbi:Putative nucleoside-diphosphate-sugar epimerase [hydrothermal vent metagenome]|uniref:Nucleoside-diphosphate-sugar epimerase n=1 Tax=hydrothermal vent metagenome TaxID=652676 RepID=A0A3B0YL63_9ZZZZ
MAKKNKPVIALVTGASSGIGRAVCQKLLQQQYKVIAAGRNIESLAEIYHDSDMQFVSLDLAKPDLVAASIATLVREYKHQSMAIDTYIGCGGYGKFGGLEQFSNTQIRELMDVNFTSHAIIVRALIPDLRRLAGHIILMGSEAALTGTRNGVMYCASKFALRGFAQALRDECGKSGLRVGIVNPGMVDTQFFDALEFAPGEDPVQHIRAEDVAEAVMLMLNQPAGTVVDEINMSPLNKVIRSKQKSD